MKGIITRTRIVIASLIGLYSIVFSITPLYAQEWQGTRRWELMLGAGGVAIPVYQGSDTMQLQPLPLIHARYTTRYLDGFLGMNGLGVRLKPGNRIPVTLSVGAGLSQGRNTNSQNGKDLDRLQGTAELTSPYHLFGMLESSAFPFGTLSSKAQLIPIEAAYDDGTPEETYDGVLVELKWKNQWRLASSMFLQTQLGMNWMNTEYAEAFYSVHTPTAYLQTFKAGSGFRDMYSSVALTYMLTHHIGTNLFVKGTYLLEDAADSPLTQDALQPSGGVFMFYNF